MSSTQYNDRQEAQMKTRKEAEARAMELYPNEYAGYTSTIIRQDERKAYLQGWEETQDTKLREAAERIAELETLCAEAMGEMPKEWRERFRRCLSPAAPNHTD